MKDKRLELKLSVRGDGSLSRDSTRSSTRSNRSNLSNNGSTGLPVSEIFAIDRFSAPQHRPFDIQTKRPAQPIQHGYPAQSLQTLNYYDQSQYPRDAAPNRHNPYIDYSEPIRYDDRFQYPPNVQYKSVYNDPNNRFYGTSSLADVNRPVREYTTVPRSILQREQGNIPYGSLPRMVHPQPNVQYYNSLPRSTQDYIPQEYSGNYTLPAPRRVRISEHQPIVYGYGMYIICGLDNIVITICFLIAGYILIYNYRCLYLRREFYESCLYFSRYNT